MAIILDWALILEGQTGRITNTILIWCTMHAVHKIIYILTGKKGDIGECYILNTIIKFYLRLLKKYLIKHNTPGGLRFYQKAFPICAYKFKIYTIFPYSKSLKSFINVKLSFCKTGQKKLSWVEISPWQLNLRWVFALWLLS